MSNATMSDVGGIMAGSLIASAILDTLMGKGVLTLADVRQTVQNARGALGQNPLAPFDSEAASILDWMLTVRFADNSVHE